MALYLLQPGIDPLGHFDFLDTDIASVLGGEVAVLDEASRTNTATEKAAQDVLDGYVADLVSSGDPAASRPLARLADGYSTVFLDATKGNIRVEPRKMFYLTDDGTANYGTLFGELIGNPVGLLTSGGPQLGPHTAQGSGKVTLWDKPGLYAVSTDAVTDALNPATGNLNDTPLPGATLYREHNTGRLTADSVTGDKVATFVELNDGGSLVTTPARLVGAAEVFDRLVIQYLGATVNAF
jgi:hypothetical protein